MVDRHVRVVCVQVGDDPGTEQFVMYSSPVPPDDLSVATWGPADHVMFAGPIDEAAVRMRLAESELSRLEIDRHIDRARATRTTVTSRAVLENWVAAISPLDR